MVSIKFSVPLFSIRFPGYLCEKFPSKVIEPISSDVDTCNVSTPVCPPSTFILIVFSFYLKVEFFIILVFYLFFLSDRYPLVDRHCFIEFSAIGPNDFDFLFNNGRSTVFLPSANQYGRFWFTAIEGEVGSGGVDRKRVV